MSSPATACARSFPGAAGAAFLVGWLTFRRHSPTPVGPGPHAAFNAALYTLDVLIPVSAIGDANDRDPHGSALAIAAGLHILGWLLAITVIAASLARSATARNVTMTQRTVTAMPATDIPIRCCHCQRSHAAPTSSCTSWLCYSSGSPRQPTTGVTWAKIADELDLLLSTRSTARPTRSGRPPNSPRLGATCLQKLTIAHSEKIIETTPATVRPSLFCPHNPVRLSG